MISCRGFSALITRLFFLLLFLLIMPVSFTAAQEEQQPEERQEEHQGTEEQPQRTGPVIVTLNPEQNRIEMDIRTSSLTELAAWARSLGLSEGGTSAELARRLRDYFKLPDSQGIITEDRRKIITIESARSTEYFKIEVVNEEYARLSGAVLLTLKDGEAVHTIRAAEILFNRTRNILTASGGVEYKKEEGEKIEKFSGESITVNIDNWESIFLGGISERSLQNGDTAYLFEGTVISRDEEDVTILNRASIRTSSNPESHWSLNASQVWLLPGSDFAIFNAVLKVGEIPVMYIPFFYYPADELIFHPVIGFRTREGNYVQTTTYILGRPTATSSSQSSLTKILGNSNDMEKQREGMFLRTTGKKAVDPGSTTLTAMVDYYANLGAYLGAELSLPAKGIFGTTDFSLGLGFTRTISEQSGFSPYWSDGTTDWNWSNLFSIDVPFRYRFKNSSSISGKYGSFSWSIPFYSDPYVDSDFVNNRSTEMDWINMIQQGAAMETESNSRSMSSIPTWTFNGSVNLKFPTVAPYINNISLNTISGSIAFNTIEALWAGSIKDYSPTRYFFAPSSANLYSVSGAISGQPLRFGQSASAQSAAAAGQPEFDDPLRNIGVPRSPFESKQDEDAQKTEQPDTLVPPVLNQRFEPPRAGNMQFSMDYSFTPSSASTLEFDSDKWKEYSDVNWGEIKNIITWFSGNANVKLNMSHSDLFSNSFSYGGDGTWRQLSYINEEAENYLTAPGSGTTDPAKISEEKRSAYSGSFFNTRYDYTATLTPLYWNTVFRGSNLRYDLGGLAVKSNFTGTGDNPEWEMIYGEWNKDKIFTHSFTGNIAANIMDKSQSISVSAVLPPKDTSLSWNANFNIWITSTRAGMSIKNPGEPDRRELGNFTLNESINFGTYGNFSQNLTLDTEKVELISLSSTLSLPKWGFSSIQYTASRQLGYEWNPTNMRWEQKTGEQTLQSSSFSVNFAKSLSQIQLFNNRMTFSFSVNSSLFLNLQQYTSSRFTFGLNFSMRVSKLLDLTLSANSDNPYIYRYLKDMWFFSDAPIEIPDGPQNNFFIDLFDSFRFDNEELRKRSGFKMKSFGIAATHYLGDWTATLNWTISPYRKNSATPPEMNNVISFSVQWIPISEIQSNINYNKQNNPPYQVSGL